MKNIYFDINEMEPGLRKTNPIVSCQSCGRSPSMEMDTGKCVWSCECFQNQDKRPAFVKEIADNPPAGAKTMDNLKLGDVEIRDDKELGFSAYIRGKQVLWLNHKGEIALFEWLAKKVDQNIIDSITDYFKTHRPSPGQKANPPSVEKKGD